MSDARILYRVQQADSKHREVSSQLRLMQQALGDNAELRAAEERVERQDHDLSHWRGRLRDQELELEGLNSKIDQTSDRLYSGEVRNPKELGSLQQDLDYLKRRRDALEDEVLRALGAIDEKEVEAAKARAALGQIDERWKQQQSDLRRAVERAEQQKEELEILLRSLRSSVDQDSLALYDDIRKKKPGRAVVPLETGLCQGCRVSVPNRLAERARAGELMTCASCGRILCADP